MTCGYAVGDSELRCMITSSHICVMHVSSGSRFPRPSVAEAGPFLGLGDRVWWISRVLVQPHARGKGLGSRLLARLVLAIKEAGGSAVVVAPGGYNANYNRQVRFYEVNGFKMVDPEGLYRMELQDVSGE
jgi:GNAT superfamily N-acetyltransferase